ncbi:NAD-dependent dihydropyrimidine dehydrogenase subunit PreA [Oxalobacter paraformigenes]|uniref:dihydrouracil dehydrogenase (NAD(+)) n=1 Tax=Oxalobacter paraformigenes TaxID=556268 RepID=C3X428_9BURK|nr:NAD-dependent dihydropyrimidine dehydrogenase subunit PreA [Oxalobacter paraformigenes]EEO27964.2 dihydroorotate dehydrogenase [Oxalobacter paraformigenes]
MALKKDLSIDFLGIRCENPFFLSSSPVSSDYVMVAKAFETGWGGVVYKTAGIFLPDECSPRFDITGQPGGPWTGFKNMEMISDKPLDVNLENMRRLKREFPDKVMIASIMGSDDDEWRTLAQKVTDTGADIIECNFSCPQMTSSAMGSDVGQSPELVARYTEAVCRATHLPVLAKMTPNIGHMELPAIAAVNAGAKGIAAINTIKAITRIDTECLSPMPVVNGKSSISGYSGPAIKPIALRFIAQMKQHPELRHIPVSGIGGIVTWKDALEFLLVGSSTVQVTSAVMEYGYRIVEDLASGLSHFMDENGIERLSGLVGKALPNIVPADDIDRDFRIIPEIDASRCIGCGRCYVSCFDGGHQAIDWDDYTRTPSINEQCVGCHLCLNVCPVASCILPGSIEFKPGRQPHPVIVKRHYT